MNYECIICFDLCKSPISCLQCSKLMCLTHVSKMGDRCPHCRLTPFAYQEETKLAEQIQYYIYKEKEKEKEKMKSNNVFRCLVEGCEFEGKYSKMIDHRKSKHYDQKLEEILFPQQRQKKKKRDILKKLFLPKQHPTDLHKKQALILYAKTKGKCDYHKFINMLMHSQSCGDPSCQRVCIGNDMAYIGDKSKHLSTCSKAQKLTHLF